MPIMLNSRVNPAAAEFCPVLGPELNPVVAEFCPKLRHCDGNHVDEEQAFVSRYQMPRTRASG